VPGQELHRHELVVRRRQMVPITLARDGARPAPTAPSRRVSSVCL
jgi:hypothetical protein